MKKINMKNIADRRQSEELLRKSEVRYRITLDNLIEGCQIVDFDYRYVYINDAAAKQGQSTKEELFGHTMMEKYPGIEKTLMFSRLKDCMILRLPQQMENEFQFEDGIIGWFNISFEPVAEGVLILSSDISEHKRAEKTHTDSEERLNFFIDNLSDYSIIFLDVNGNITRWNSGAQHIKLYKSEEIIGKNFSIFFTEADQRDNKPQIMLSKAISDGQSIHEGWRVRKGGSLFWASVTIISLKKKDGSHYGFTKITHDLTEQKLAEDKIKKLNETLEQKVIERTFQLESANKELEAFSYSISHDLRAPLRHIGGFIDLLVKNNSAQLDETGLRYLKTISDSSKEMGNLIDALLSFSRLGKTDPQLTKANSRNIINRALKYFNNEIAERNIEINILELPSATCDENLIIQVWVNLISNAIKYSKNKEKAIIEIGGKTEPNEIVFYIKDNGAGFNMKYADKLFGVFQRLHKARDFEGIGIGLANVNRIILRHGGKCWAESEVDKGATFYFSLPIYDS